jgi:CRP/FNR family transcriptional regulator, cyclic AMP receptor protein
MDDVLELCAGLPTRTFRPGETLLSEGTPGSAMYVLVTGLVEVRKGAVAVTKVADPGSFLGEMSALLGTPYSADVVALEPTDVIVVEEAAAMVTSSPELALAIARLLARRLQAVTSYLGDIKRQYAGADGHLAMMDQVLSELIAMRPRSIEPGSERSDVPDY